MRVMMITGAGISTGSGLGTYRGKGGLYTQLEEELGMPVEQFLSTQTLKQNPDLIWEYWMRHMGIVTHAQPSKAHLAIAELARRSASFLEVTQNVDGLSLKAGLPPESLIELHGSFTRFKCMQCAQPYSLMADQAADKAPYCGCCGVTTDARIRPDVVLFGELINQVHFDQAMAFAKTTNYLILSGTTLMFPYLAGFIHTALEYGAEVIYIDPEASSQAPMLQILGVEHSEQIDYRQVTADEGLADLLIELEFVVTG
jgi:NAD-dependent deacetylase